MSLIQRIHLEHLRVTLTTTGATTTYAFAGALDEAFRYRGIPAPTTPAVTFDLREVHTLNSCGVREWVFFVRGFAGHRPFDFEEVSVAFVDQLNIVPQMLGHGRVRSLYAPFYCPSCDEEVNELLACEEHRATLLARKAPVVAHRACGRPLEFDALEDCYFHQAERFLG